MRATCTGPRVCLVHFYYPPVKNFWSFNFCMGLQELWRKGCYENLDLEHRDLRPPGCLENTDPQFNIFQMSILLSAFNFQLAIYQSTKRGVAWYLGHVSIQFIPLKWTNKWAVFKYGYDQEWYHRAIQVDYDTTPSFREWLGILKPPRVFLFVG